MTWGRRKVRNEEPTPIAEVLDEAARPTVQGDDYEWQELHGAKAIREYHVARRKIGTVKVDGYNPDILGYGDGFEGAHEAYLYADGSILICCSVASWGGTFASHDDVYVRYYGLTPKDERDRSAARD